MRCRSVRQPFIDSCAHKEQFTQRKRDELQGYEAMSSVQWCRRREERIVCYVWKMTQAF